MPGSPNPRTSVRQFIELAVNIPEHEPHVGHDLHSNSFNSSLVIFPLSTEPTASNSVDNDTASPLYLPANIGPPLTNTEGILSLNAAIIIPGTILSQLGINTKASKPWAFTIHSTLSAINSLVANEYFIPSWPIAIPSHTPMVGNTNGVPPLISTPFLVASTILSKLICPGIISFCDVTIPIRGLSNSSSLNPIALKRALCGALPIPFLTISLLIYIHLYTLLNLSITSCPIFLVPTRVVPSL